MGAAVDAVVVLLLLKVELAPGLDNFFQVNAHGGRLTGAEQSPIGPTATIQNDVTLAVWNHDELVALRKVNDEDIPVAIVCG